MNHQRADEAVKPVVLLAAETNFVTDYVASVLRERATSVIGPLVDPSQAVQLLATQSVRAASCSIPQPRRIAPDWVAEQT
ncbi:MULTISPECIES: hypothetical protein [unclassified Sphingomonas]|uniref:hypothetical protein n=1 Tax=unclassified Sphingomonas TaxID=196159 RepID=UPI002866D2FB|nr:MULTISPECIES: hypothetical protein [unclassified Sphingomonas]MDR6116121.1 hypothetical protein [Sphingomonas sp. SORGH_AS_0789]MDR6150206.1 hypothetical protein [Sphingomonas sp. SORGH_AS_0742]